MNRRSLDLDALRGTAIVLMVVFHVCFDLNHFRFIAIDIYNGIEWHLFRYLIVSLFLFCVGVGLQLAHGGGIRWEKIKKRSVILLTAALAITGVTYFVLPASWIYFGILHFILFASLAGLLFLNRPVLAVAVTAVIFAGSWNDTLNTHWLFNLFSDILPERSDDVVRPFPWFGAVLLGMAAGKWGLYRLRLPDAAPVRGLAFLGRHSLVIYLTHQPVLFGAAMAAYHLGRS